jgi:hypothetical protein
MSMKNTTLVGDVPQPPSGDAPEQDGFRSKRHLKAAFGSLCVIVLMVALDATSLAVALPVSHALRIMFMYFHFS